MGSRVVLRLVCRECDYGAAANIGGPVYQGVKTFDMCGPEVERLANWINAGGPHGFRFVDGVEVIQPDAPDGTEEPTP